MDDPAKARRILECVREFQKGCSAAGPYTYAHGIGPADPSWCDTCLAAFLCAVSSALKK